jgi:hypothetical protein
MGLHFSVWGSAACALIGLGLTSSLAIAQEIPAETLAGISIPDAVDYNSRASLHETDDSWGGDAKFMFGLEYRDRTITKTAGHLEALYRDLLHQQDIDNPIMRTRDLPSPFGTSLSQMQNPSSFSGLDNGFNSTFPPQ